MATTKYQVNFSDTQQFIHMQNKRIDHDEIEIGKILPWNVYDKTGTLLLQKGSIITSDHQLDILLGREIYKTDEQLKNSKDTQSDDHSESPFALFHDFMARLSENYSRVILKKKDTQEQIIKFCMELQDLCEKHPDAMLSTIHLCHEPPYPPCHSLHCAVLCELICNRLGFDKGHRISVIAAALTCNIAMLDIQEILSHQKASLTEDQKRIIHEHPHKSAAILSEAGITDELWLKSIRQHHERINGSGYPDKIDGSALIQEAEILAIADRYSAMVSSRSYRKPLMAKEALRNFFLIKNEEFTESLSLLFIKELGIFPPGSYVKLVNGEVGVVVNRSKDTMKPKVSSIYNPQGSPYASPMLRNTSIDAYNIKEMHIPDRPLHISLPVLWGFTE